VRVVVCFVLLFLDETDRNVRAYKGRENESEVARKLTTASPCSVIFGKECKKAVEQIDGRWRARQ
jgi:hypothetical protein